MTTADSTSPAARAYSDTRRLLVRRLASTDTEDFAAYRADSEVARYQSWTDYTVEHGRSLIESMHGIRPGVPGHWYQYARERCGDGTIVGDGALKLNESEPSEAEFGVTLAPTHRGNGYCAEAVGGLLAYAFGALQLRRVIAVTDALNDAAGALLDRVGMQREAHFLDDVFFKGAWGSESLTAILRQEWEAETDNKEQTMREPETATAVPSTGDADAKVEAVR